MSDAALETLGIWLFVPSLALIFVLAVVQRNQVSRSSDPVRRQQQRKRLTTVAREQHDRGELVIDWIAFRDLSRADLTEVLGKHGWHYRRQEITGREWRLVFCTTTS
ncbi:hypothetical protein [Saccharomonospora iraqiensis]|uniref:hypothetical protein n=1 Tax=Saccharomonospora iraqiensis TaxID=52698 RepID=UPI000422F6EF|nr:hypothetical protein [Saccharomonospora iraqiensis]